MQYRLLGHPSDGPTLDLDYREFAYAGKFVMSKTGKSVAFEGETIVGAIAFSADHDDSDVGHLRYVTVRDDRQGKGIGSRLLRVTADKLHQETYESVVIAVNNPVAYRACYRAGFSYTGEQTGIAEVVLRYTPDGERAADSYREGLAVFEDRDIPPDQQTVLEKQELPSVIDCPDRIEVSGG
jgi:GNAT superfamily N-acetyltransferase